MAAQKGREVLIKVGDGGDPSETFTTLAGARTVSLSFGSEVVDISAQDSTGNWRELLPAAGSKSMSLSLSGVFVDNATDATLRTAAFAQTAGNYQFIMPNFGTFEGPFQITGYELSGDMNDAAQFSVTFESAGEVTFTAA